MPIWRGQSGMFLSRTVVQIPSLTGMPWLGLKQHPFLVYMNKGLERGLQTPLISRSLVRYCSAWQGSRSLALARRPIGSGLLWSDTS